MSITELVTETSESELSELAYILLVYTLVTDYIYLDKGRKYFYLIFAKNQKHNISQMFYKKVFLKNSQNSQKDTCAGVSFFEKKLHAGGLLLY